jgi:hypothetical protein
MRSYYSRLFKNTFTNLGKASFSSIVPTGLVCFMCFRTAYTADIQETNCLLCASTTIQFVSYISSVNSNFFFKNRLHYKNFCYIMALAVTLIAWKRRLPQPLKSRVCGFFVERMSINDNWRQVTVLNNHPLCNGDDV